MAKIRTRARAVDMLGRQQIAGTQNAISEIFKNAHDAYAKHVRIDFFEDEGTLVIRDDGVGMTKEDFEEKWLVLGTESKAAQNRELGFRPRGIARRQITGEKGIGRLAIALLGRQVLVLTRAVREDGLHDLVMGLIHWGLFEIPGLNLDEIEIPVMTVSGGTLPTTREIVALKAPLLGCLEKLKRDHPSLNLSAIRADLNAFQPDPDNLDQFLCGDPKETLRLVGQLTGTHFIIGPANPVLEIELAVEERNQDWSFRKQLLGFADHVFGAKGETSISTSFHKWPHRALAGSEILDAETFFTRAELDSKSDHLLGGTVNDFGQFKGSLRVYQQNYDDVVVPWSEARGLKTECGPFEIVFGYLQGRESESLVVGADWAELNSKLDKIGGIYVYRDGIRILPYGDFSFDWLEVEKRRSKGAGYYFFSFRRMFGAVLLSREANGQLQEKAGREGFQQNRAYRQLRDILGNLLIYLAGEFFRGGKSEKGDMFERTQAEMKMRAEALARQQKRSGEKRKQFAKALENFFEAAKAGTPDREVEALKALTRSRMEASSRIEDQDRAAASLIQAERDAIKGLNGLRERFACKRPTAVALTKELAREWDGYRIERERLDLKVFGPCEEEIARTLGEVARRARLFVDQRKRLEDRIKALSEERHKQLQNAVNLARDSASDTRKTVFDIRCWRWTSR